MMHDTTSQHFYLKFDLAVELRVLIDLELVSSI